MYHKKMPSRFEQRRALTHDVPERAKQLMSCHCFMFRHICQPVGVCHIWRICRDNIKGSRLKIRRRFPNITRRNMYPSFQTIIKDTASRHIRNILLNLQSLKPASLCLCRKQNRYDPITTPEIQNTAPLWHFHKRREQNRIHTKTKPIRILYNPKSPALQIVQALAFPQILIVIKARMSHQIFDLPSFFSIASSAFSSLSASEV